MAEKKRNTYAPSENNDDANYSPEEHSNKDNSEKETATAKQQSEFPIVGIGASAGGLKAFEQFFQNMPQNSGMAFVLIQHLAPHHESELAELLQNHTRMKVMQVQDNTRIEPNQVYVIPPGKSLSVKNRTLLLSEPLERRGHRAPIDFFFRSLADDQGENAICVVLSGTGTDGTLGLRAVKERAGITMAQSTTDAEYEGMPKSAMRTGLVDLVGTAAELAQKLIGYKDSADKIQLPDEEEALPEDDSEALTRIFTQLRAKTGHDFTHYKRSTILRRISRRLQVNQINSITEYLAYLRNNPDEVHALFKDFLISVTNFFRDPESFAVLEKEIIPKLFLNKKAKDQIRVWVAGCATGEEAYSIAMLLNEYASLADTPISLQIFATDIDDEAIAFAREGLYPESIAADISPERLRRFFTDEVSGYRVKKEIRESVLFAIHNLIEDAPFSKLDLISCRNLLIYLDRDIQEKVFELFHYAMRPSGYLFLGSSESTDPATNLFIAQRKKQRIFKRRDSASTGVRFPRLPLVKTDNLSDETTKNQKPGSKTTSLEDLYQAWTLKKYAPPRLIVNDNYEITHIFSGADRYLKEQEGPVTQNILHKIVPGLRLDLRTALYQAFVKGEKTESRYLHAEINQEPTSIKLHVGPIEESGFPRDYIEVIFEEQKELVGISTDITKTIDENATQLISRLEEEVQRTREQLQSTVEEYETSNEELKASNEELQSMNEEMQSTTEELETSKEELQSTNEELITVNQELKNKIEELNRANSDLQNLMASTDIGTVFLDRHLHLKRFTPKACEIFNIITADLGRPFDHISHKLHYDSLSADVQQVLKSLSKIEREAQTKDDRWYVITILPYRTLHDKIDGVVLTSVEVTELKQVEKELKQRVLQQATVAQLGKMALAGTTLDELMDTATGCICEALEIELCKILELMPNHKDFLLKAGTGWQEGSVGQVHIPNNKNSQAGYTLVTHEPVIVENLPQETRFSGPEFLTEHDVISGMSVIIGDSEKPYGVLGAHSKKSRTFSRYDVNFILSVANILAEVLNRKQAEEALQLNREIIQHQLSEIEAIYTTAPVGLAFLDSELRFVRINERLAEINGLSVSDHLGHTPAEILPELDEIVNPYLQQAITGHSELNVELHGTTPAAPGVERDWLASYLPLKGPDNEVAGINTVIQEITETKRARKALEASEERFRRAVVEAPFPILAHAEDGEIVMISNVVTDLTGYTVEEIQTVEAWVKAVYPNEMQPQIKKGVENLYELTDRLDEGEFEITTKEGHKRIWHFHSAPLGTDEQGRRLVISMASDVTKRKEFEEALQKNQQRLKELNETLEQRVVERTEELTRIIQDLDQFAYVASHDLKTPLRAIDNLAAWITEDAADNLPEASKEHLEKMRDRVHRMETLLNDLLAYSRAGRDHEEIEEVDTGELVGNILTILALPKRFTVDVQPDMPHVRTNRPLLEMVLRNLIDNAIKHHDRSDGLITVSANRSGKDIVFSVTDDGPGIDPAFHTRIFQIFQTLQSKDKNGGSGVGLAIVKKIIEARGGSIEVESITGQGATFRFTWPGDQSLV